MNVFQAPDELVHKELLVMTRDAWIKPDYIMQISVHEVCYYVQLIKS